MSDDWGDFDATDAGDGERGAESRSEPRADEGTGKHLERLSRLLESGSIEDVQEVAQQLRYLADRAPDDEAEEDPPQLHFPTLDRFVEDYLVQIYRRDLEEKNLRWCSEWWQHGEAIARLEALWRSWELLRLDPGEGGSNWWLGHCDPHMAKLLSENGTFRHCRTGHAANRSKPLPATPPPGGLFG